MLVYRLPYTLQKKISFSTFDIDNTKILSFFEKLSHLLNIFKIN